MRCSLMQYMKKPFITYSGINYSGVVPFPVAPKLCRSGWIVYTHNQEQRSWRTVGYSTAIRQFPQPSHTHTSNTYSNRRANLACHCTPLFTEQSSLCSTTLLGLCTGNPSEDRFLDIGPRGLSNNLQHNCAIFCCNVVFPKLFLLQLLFSSLLQDCREVPSLLREDRSLQPCYSPTQHTLM